MQVGLFPNPANECMDISIAQHDHAEYAYKVISVNGDYIDNFKTTLNDFLLNTSAYNSGQYLINVYSGSELMVTKKFTVLH